MHFICVKYDNPSILILIAPESIQNERSNELLSDMLECMVYSSLMMCSIPKMDSFQRMSFYCYWLSFCQYFTFLSQSLYRK